MSVDRLGAILLHTQIGEIKLKTQIVHTGRIQTPKNDDVGYDLYFEGIEDTTGTVNLDVDVVALQPGDSISILTGVRTQTVVGKIRNWALTLLFGAPVHLFPKIQDRSGVAVQQNLKTSAGIIDPGYTGEIVVKITNIGTTIAHLHKYHRICQFILIPAVMAKLVNVDDHEFTFGSARGSDGFGSSGNL